MSLRTLLGLDAPARGAGRSALATAIAERLTHLSDERSELVTAFAGLLVRVAHADRHVSPEERTMLMRLVAEHSALSPEEAGAVSDIVLHHATGLAGIDYSALTRAYNARADMPAKERLIDCLYAVAGADRSISVTEDEEIRAVSRALLLSHGQFIAVRRRHADRLEVLQAVRRRPRS